MKLCNVQKHVRDMMRLYTNRNSIVIDATCGNGIDTEFLANRCLRVYAFDIQSDAIENTKKRCNKYTNIKYINDSHANVDKYVFEKVDLAVFNLGYLPNSDLEITTKSSSTIIALKAIIKLLKKDQAIIITVYSGHDEGIEKRELHEFIKTLDPSEYAILKYEFLNLLNAPYNLIIEKKID